MYLSFSHEAIMKHIKFYSLTAAVLLTALTPVFADDRDWIPLLNGQDLTGWTPKFTGHALGENPGNTFRVEDGMLRVAYDDAAVWSTFQGRFGHLFFEQEFSDYRLRVEYRFIGDQVHGGPGWGFRNNGIMIHGQSAESMGQDQKFPASIEVQLLGGNGQNERFNLNACTPHTHVVYQGKLAKQHVIKADSRTFHGDEWVTVEIEVRGHQVVRHKIDGETVGRQEIARRGGAKLSGGSISIQAESHPTDFRKIELLPLAAENTE